MICRFSQLDKSSNTRSPAQGSVFNRIQTNSSRRQASSVSSRLNRPVAGGIRKSASGGRAGQLTDRRGGARAVKPRSQRSVGSTSRVTRRDAGSSRGRRGGPASQRPTGKSDARRTPNTKPGKGRAGDKKKKPLTAEDLDKSLDDYMMKDPKTAQSRLDADLTKYMDEANDDELMELQ